MRVVWGTLFVDYGIVVSGPVSEPVNHRILEVAPLVDDDFDRVAETAPDVLIQTFWAHSVG